jgi:hypothetical protein
VLSIEVQPVLLYTEPQLEIQEVIDTRPGQFLLTDVDVTV